MKNFEKFKTAEERARAFDRFCSRRECGWCELMVTCRPTDYEVQGACLAFWLDLEFEDEPLPCPCCHREVTVEEACTNKHPHGWFFLACGNEDCLYSSGMKPSRASAISHHNQYARSVMEAKKEGDK